MTGKLSACIFALHIVVLKEYIFDFPSWLHIDFTLFFYLFLSGNAIRGISTSPIAFYASMSSNEPNVGTHHLLIFDHELLNVRNGYHPNSGVFIAPESGIYVFMWTLRLFEQSIVLVVNGIDYTSIYNRAFDHDGTLHTDGADESVTGYAIARVNQGEDVFLRSHSSYTGTGDIFSNEFGLSTFGGWILC